MIATVQRIRRRFLPLGLAVLAITLTAATMPATAATIDLTYDSIMDMVRPVQRAGIAVHHDLEIVFTGQAVIENRDRNTGNRSDSNATRQGLGGAEPTGVYVSWRVESPTRLVRTERDPQSTRTMIVTLTPGSRVCRLDVMDTLAPGYREFAFRRVASPQIGYFSSYRVVQTSCSVR